MGIKGREYLHSQSDGGYVNMKLRKDATLVYYYSKGNFRVYEHDQEEVENSDSFEGKLLKIAVEIDNAYDERWIFTLDLVDDAKDKIVARFKGHLVGDPNIDDVSWYVITLLGHLAKIAKPTYLSVGVREFETAKGRREITLYFPEVRVEGNRRSESYPFKKGTPKAEAYLQGVSQLLKSPLMQKDKELEGKLLKEVKSLAGAKDKEGKKAHKGNG